MKPLALLMLLAQAAIAAAGDYYEVLGVARDADDNAIKRAYRKLSLKLHPGETQGDAARHGSAPTGHTGRPSSNLRYLLSLLLMGVRVRMACAWRRHEAL